MVKKPIKQCLVILLIGLVLAVEPSFAKKESDVLTSITTGSQEIVKHDIQKARQKAVSKALQVAVQNAFAELVSRQVFASNLDFFYDFILTQTEKYIVTYKVLNGIENQNQFLVGVESKVDLKRLEKTLTDARILSADNDKPSLLLFVAEQTPSDLLPRYWWGKNPIPYESAAEKIIVES